MYSNIFLFSMLLCLTYGAPQDLITQLNDTVTDLEEIELKPIEAEQPNGLMQTYDPQEAQEYVGKDPEPTLTFELSEPLTDEPIDQITEDESPSLRPMQKQTIILNAGKHLSEAITAKIVGPVVIFNSKVAAAAGALPPMLAAKGAVIGSAIATPIEIGAVAGSSIVSGVTGKLVAVPISVATGAVAKLVGAAENGRQIWNFNIEHGHEIFKDGVIKLGHIILKPIAVIVGAQTALTGIEILLYLIF